jgi:hypothetical protein
MAIYTVEEFDNRVSENLLEMDKGKTGWVEERRINRREA